MLESLANLSKILVHTPNNSRRQFVSWAKHGDNLKNNFINVDLKIDRVQYKRRL
jgi:hypothetical protein